MPIVIITKIREDTRNSKDQIRKLIYQRLNATIVIRWDTTKVNVPRIRNKRRERERANVVDETPPKKNKTEESEVKDL